MLLVLSGVYLGAQKPAADRRVAELEGSIAAAEERAADASRRLVEQRRASEAVELKLRAAETEIELLKQRGSKGPSPVPPPSPTVKRSSGPPPPPPPPINCLKGDPLCG
jgi:hypothetical protein